jgi:hypothetical protein
LLLASVLLTGAITVSGADATGAGKFRLVIEESGTSSRRPVRYRGGQRYEIHGGVDTMHTKKGELTLTFTGPSVNAGSSLYIEYGTWHISGASGIYKGWKGGGYWGGTDDEQTYHIQWEGLITRR